MRIEWRGVKRDEDQVFFFFSDFKIFGKGDDRKHAGVEKIGRSEIMSSKLKLDFRKLQYFPRLSILPLPNAFNPFPS